MTVKSPTNSQGKIITYSADAAAGVILCENGHNYPFHVQDWMSEPSELQDDIPVVFSVSSGRAVKVSKSAR